MIHHATMWRFQVASLLLLPAVLVACTHQGATNADSTAEPCVVEEQPANPRAVIGGDTVLRLDEDQSPEYCTNEQVLADYRAALELALWYDPPRTDDACTSLEPPADYPADLMDDLADFYTGELLHSARETVYYNQRAQPRRIILACWDFAEFDRQFDEGMLETEWQPDGRHVVVRQEMWDYRLMIYEVHHGTAELIDEVVDDQVRGLSSWTTTLVYDTSGETGRWKIVHAENSFPELY
jgi:hypothetical protein